MDATMMTFIFRETEQRGQREARRAAGAQRLALTVSCAVASVCSSVVGAEPQLPAAKPVPAVQVIPLPYDQASFQLDGRELTRYHFGPSLRRPFLYPMMGAAGRSLTRMGHPHDPITHCHHNSVWISHADVGGVNTWADPVHNVPKLGRIVHQRVEEYTDGPQSASMLTVNTWEDGAGKVLPGRKLRADGRGAG
jgi:hypothetical protein